MASISSLFNVGTRSMNNAKAGLQTTNHNISNANTPGYSVQRAETQTSIPEVGPNYQIGTGAELKSVTRAHSDFLQNQLIEAEGNAGFYRNAAIASQEVETIYNEAINEKLNKSFSEFFNSFRAFSQDPDAEALRKSVLETANVLVKEIHATNEKMEATRRSIDFRVRQSASKINDLLAKVAHLNSTILRLKSQGVEPNDEMDSRDLAVREVSKYMDVRCSYDDKGHYNLTLGGKMPLVTGESAYHFETVPTERDAPGEGTKQDGALDIFLVSESGTFHPIRHAIKNGELYGLIHVRDDVMTELKDRMDRMVGTFASKVNAIHRQGFGRDGLSGRNLFSGVGVGSIEFPESFVDGMERIHLNFDTSQTNMLAHALVPHAPSDNRVPLAIAALEHDRIYENGTVTLQDFYAATVGDLGVKVKSFRDSDDNFGSILRQLNTYHQSVTGVSMDEEAAKMVQMQHQFNASAKMIRTADELMETVLSLKR